jgi:hypothetical protein
MKFGDIESEGHESEITADFDDIPFEIQRPGDEDANQMTLF